MGKLKSFGSTMSCLYIVGTGKTKIRNPIPKVRERSFHERISIFHEISLENVSLMAVFLIWVIQIAVLIGKVPRGWVYQFDVFHAVSGARTRFFSCFETHHLTIFLGEKLF